MSRSNSASSAKPATARTRPYKDFLTPAFHRSFTNAALVGLLVCWVEATCMSQFSLLWSWFPFGWTGLRAGLLFISCLTIFILRVAFLHVGQTTHRSAFEGYISTLVSRRAVLTIIWYWISAFLFSEIYIFSTSETANLAWIDPGRSYERLRINERAVLLRSMFAQLAVIQGLRHLVRDFDALDIPRKDSKAARSQQRGMDASVSELVKDSYGRIRRQALDVAVGAMVITLTTAIFTPVAYFLFFRTLAWNMAYGIGKVFYNLHKSTSPTGIVDIASLLLHYIYSSLLLMLLWESTNRVFTFYASQPPLKKGLPLTSGSRDPNASLVNGLKSRKELPHSFALCELRIIAEDFDERRKTIYSDYERPGLTIWADILSTCLAEIEGLSTAVRESQDPPQPEPSAPAVQEPPPKQRIAQPLKSDQQIFNPSPKPNSPLEKMTVSVGAVAKRLGSTPSSSPIATKARSVVSTKLHSESSLLNRSLSKLHLLSLDLLRTPLGVPFRVPFDANISAILLGHPHSRASDIDNAVVAISQLVIHSLTEDGLGQVQHDIATVTRAIMNATQDVQGLMQTLEPHWTDVDFDGQRRCREVERIVTTLKSGLEGIVNTFGEYAANLGFSKQEMRTARDLAGAGREMVRK